MTSFSLPLSLPVFLNTSSTEPYSDTSFIAVFGPTPGAPGILSAVSPIRARISITCSGFATENSRLTSSTPHFMDSFPLLDGFNIKIVSVTSCAKSLSGVIMYVTNPFPDAFLDSVPIISSASKPG